MALGPEVVALGETPLCADYTPEREGTWASSAQPGTGSLLKHNAAEVPLPTV